MSTIAFVTVPAGGNIPPFTAIGRTLRARGHDVHVIGHDQLHGLAEAEGFGFTALRSVGFFSDKDKRSTVPAEIRDAVRLMSGGDIRREVADSLRRLRPDAVLVDALMASSVIGARDAGVPAATLFHTYYEYWRTPFHGGALGWLTRARGVNLLRAWNTADEQFVISDPSWIPPGGRRGRTADRSGSARSSAAPRRP